MPARACPTALDREQGSWGHPGPMAGQSRAVGAGDHPCCGITGTGPDSPWGQQWGPGLWSGLGEALGEARQGW